MILDDRAIEDATLAYYEREYPNARYSELDSSAWTALRCDYLRNRVADAMTIMWSEHYEITNEEDRVSNRIFDMLTGDEELMDHLDETAEAVSEDVTRESAHFYTARQQTWCVIHTLVIRYLV